MQAQRKRFDADPYNDYFWDYSDNSAAVTSGTGGVKYGGVIQNPDAYGGYNVSFSVPGKLCLYHIHFQKGGTRVKVVRYKSTPSVEGENIIRHKNDVTKPVSLATLAGACKNDDDFKNHALLLNAFKEAIKNVARGPNGELQ